MTLSRIKEIIDAEIKCAGSECYDHDCVHCAYCTSQDERLECFQTVMKWITENYHQKPKCPFNTSAHCAENCGLFDENNQCCSIKTISRTGERINDHLKRR